MNKNIKYELLLQNGTYTAMANGLDKEIDNTRLFWCILPEKQLAVLSYFCEVPIFPSSK